MQSLVHTWTSWPVDCRYCHWLDKVTSGEHTQFFNKYLCHVLWQHLISDGSCMIITTVITLQDSQTCIQDNTLGYTVSTAKQLEGRPSIYRYTAMQERYTLRELSARASKPDKVSKDHGSTKGKSTSNTAAHILQYHSKRPQFCFPDFMVMTKCTVWWKYDAWIGVEMFVPLCSYGLCKLVLTSN